ncbi:hypothetical protein [Flavobacterium sp. 25HG05S-40]|uniref:hypothetical protein n=1 Tax=Flavobacterium sp. 25HG05S-40 TaxID=3458682 RepID=UPI00404395A8
MKTRQFFFSAFVIILLGTTTLVNAQATQANNAILATDYLGSSNNVDVLFKRNAVSAGKISTNIMHLGLNSFAGNNSTSIGSLAGQYCTTGILNSVYVGHSAGQGSTTTANSGYLNTYIGNSAGNRNTTGGYNAFFGGSAGFQNSSGSSNTYIGVNSGSQNTTGSNNTFIGRYSGQNNVGSSNVFVGYSSGYNETGSNKLYIDNSNTATPLVWGDFANDEVKLNGKVGIGAVTTFPTNAGGVSVANYKLFVTGGILTDEVRVNLSAGGTWADYVFHKDYNLKSLSEVESFIKENGHLPNVPSAAQVKEEGIALGEMSKLQQEKIEELTLYVIAQNKEIELLKTQVKEIEALKKMMTELINKK